MLRLFSFTCSPSQLYLVLDITNLTNEEMDFHYTPTKHILIEGKESRRVPVPLDRCPFTTPITKIEEGRFTVAIKTTAIAIL